MTPAVGKTGTDPGKLQGSLEERFLQALTVSLPIDVSSITLVIHDGRDDRVPADVFSIIDGVNRNELPFAGLLVEKDLETVTLLKGKEVN